MKKRKRPLPDGCTEEHLRYVIKELRMLQAWTDGYQAAIGGGPSRAIPGTGLMTGLPRAVSLINQLLQEAA